MSRGAGRAAAGRTRFAFGRRLAAIALCAPLAACGDRVAREPGPEAGGPPVYGGTLVIAAPTDLDAPNGLVSGEVRTQEFIRNTLYMTLVRLGPGQEFEPYLAESWEFLGDTGVVFRLREDVRWHDGVPTTAYDVAFTYSRAKEPETAFPNGSFFLDWDAVEVLDSFTVRFEFEPHADPLAGLPYFPIMPRHLLDSIPPARLRQAAFNHAPVGNGPFRFVSYRSNDRWIFEANPDFPEALGGRPYLDRVVWRVVPENQAQISELRAGTADLILGARADQIGALDERPEFRAIVRPARKYQVVAWNGLRPPLDDPRVRRALTLGIHRAEMLQGLRAGLGQLAIGPIFPGHWAFNDAIEPLPYDTAAARELLAQAGFTDRDGDGWVEDATGKPLAIALSTPNTEYNRDVAEKLESDLRRIGVRLEIRLMDFATMVGNVFSEERRFDAAILAWESSLRPDELRDNFHSEAIGRSFQISSYRNAEVDRILDRARRLSDRAEAIPLWHRLQEILHEDQPWTFLYYTPDLFVVNERVRGVEMDIRGPFESLPRWWKVPAEEPPVAAAGAN